MKHGFRRVPDPPQQIPDDETELEPWRTRVNTARIWGLWGPARPAIPAPTEPNPPPTTIDIPAPGAARSQATEEDDSNQWLNDLAEQLRQESKQND